MAMTNAREPAGDAWREALARRGGKEYTGGPVCWEASQCEGVCRECRTPVRQATAGGAA